MNANTIDVDEKGNCTVVGALAHQLWSAGGFPKTLCSQNRYYVYEFNELPQGWRWEVVGWSQDPVEASANQVVVNVSNAPMLI